MLFIEKFRFLLVNKASILGWFQTKFTHSFPAIPRDIPFQPVFSLLVSFETFHPAVFKFRFLLENGQGDVVSSSEKSILSYQITAGINYKHSRDSFFLISHESLSIPIVRWYRNGITNVIYI
jgi:hypothetical protein